MKAFGEKLAQLKSTEALAYFDMQCHMPKKGMAFRSGLLAQYSSALHEHITGPHVAKLLKKRCVGVDKIAQQKLAEVYEKNRKIPASLVHDFAKTSSQAHEAWLEAREKNNFSVFEPYLLKLVQLAKKKAKCIDPKKHPYEVLIDDFEEGMTIAELDALFSRLKPKLIELRKKIQQSKTYKLFKSKFSKEYDKEAQTQAVEDLIDMIIPDRHRFSWGETTHPFMIHIAPDDIRIACGFRNHIPLFSFGSCAHECGHALYELQFDKKWRNSILYDGTSLGIHESQSRFWENHVMSSLAFWKGYFPRYKKLLNLSHTLDQFYLEANHVAGSLVRIEGDEVTYCLHIIIRYELEKALMEGKIKVKDLPKLWDAKYKEAFGTSAKKLLHGVLQDSHWSSGLFGYFPTYALGSMYAAVIEKEMKKDIRQFNTLITKQSFDKIRQWLQQHVHRYASSKKPKEILQKLTKEDPADVYLDYLYKKYSALYKL